MQAEASFLDKVITPSTYAVLARVSPGYPPLPGRLPTCYSPVRRSPETEASFAHDLHVLSTPPAFILSQDQTLQFKSCACPSRYSPTGSLFEIYSQLNSTPTTSRRTPPMSSEPESRAADFTHFSLSSFQRTDAEIAAFAAFRVPLVSKGRRSVGQVGAGVNP